MILLHLIHLLLKPEEDTRTIEVRAVTDAMEQADKRCLVADMPLHEVIKTRCDQDTQHQYDIQLDVDRTACHVADPPAQHHEEVQDQNRKGRGGMRVSQANEHVVQVRLVRWNGDLRFRIRVVITRSVSKTGTGRTAKVKGISPIFAAS